jgi:hypothetical protein
MLHRIVQVVVRILLATMVAVIVMMLPPPSGFPAWMGRVETPIVVLGLVCYIGKLLYDTLFYNHYRA